MILKPCHAFCGCHEWLRENTATQGYISEAEVKQVSKNVGSLFNK